MMIKVKVADYRDAISSLVDAFADLRSLHADDNRPAEEARARRLRDELNAMECPRATERDRYRAKSTVKQLNIHLGDY